VNKDSITQKAEYIKEVCSFSFILYCAVLVLYNVHHRSVHTYLYYLLPSVISNINKLQEKHAIENFLSFYHFQLKGTVSRDFRLLVFFMNQFPPSL
jgi:hypothetical protein